MKIISPKLSAFSLIVVAVTAWALLSTTVFIGAPGVTADDNPATDPLTQQCEAVPSSTDLVQSGVSAATIGEVVTWTQEVELAEGDVYQDILSAPDGTLFYASYFEIEQIYDTDPGSFLTLSGGPTFSIEGVPVATIPGTEPDPAGFVLESTTSATGAPVWRVYFPGDVAQMLADTPGEGSFSYAVPAGGETFALSFETVVDDDPAVVAGVTLDGASCYAQISSGPSNRNTDRDVPAISIVEPFIEIDKVSSASGGVTASPSVLTYDITVSNPGVDATGTVVYSTAYSVVLVDVLPAEASPLDGAGAPLADGAATASGGVYDAAANTLTWDPVGDVATGAPITVSYDVAVDAGLGGATELTNTVVADMWSAPDQGGRPYDDAATDDEVVTVGGAEPTLNKSLTYNEPTLGDITEDDPAVVGGPLPIAYDFTQTVEVVLQPDSAHFNTTVQDIIPDGLEFVSFDSATCEIGTTGPGSCAAPTGQTQTPAELPSGLTPLLWFIGDVTTAADAWTYTFTYTVRIKPAYAAGAPVQIDDIFTNSVDLYWNIVDRLGAGVVPTPGGVPPVWDGTLTDTTSVSYGRPVLDISKVDLVDPEPTDLPTQGGPIEWQIEVTNSGSMDAVNVDISDVATADLTNVTIVSSSDPVTQTPSGFNVPGPIAPGATFTMIISTIVDGTESSTQVSVNTADISCYRDRFGPADDPSSDRPCYDDVDEATDAVPYVYPDVSIDKTLVTIDPPQEQDDPFSTGHGGPIWFQVDLVNDGAGTAWNVALSDTAPAGFCAADIGFLDVDGTTPIAGLSFSSLTTAAFDIVGVANLAPGDGAAGGPDEFSFLYAITPCGVVADSPLYENRIDVAYEDGLGNTSIDGDDYADDASDSFGAASPTLALTKSTTDTLVALDTTPGDDNYEIVEWTIEVQNTSATQWAYTVVVADTVPTGLLMDFGDAIAQVPQPSATAVMTDNSTSGTDLEFVIASIPPGGSVTITVPTYQDGTIPAPDDAGDYIMVNTATVTSANAACDPTLVCTDDAQTELTVPWFPPTLQKTVADADEPVDASDDPDSSASGVAGEDSLQYTLTVTVPDNDPESTNDVWVKDVIPHGIEIDPGSIAIACAGAGCDAAATSLGLVATYPNFYEEYAFWLGDVGVGGATYTITYDAEVLLTFDDGTAVLGGSTYFYTEGDEKIEQLAATPFINQAELQFNAPLLIGGSGDVVTADPYAEDGDGDATTHANQDGQVSDTAQYDVETPLLVVDKVADRYRPTAGDLYIAPTAGSPIEWGLGFQNDGVPANSVFDDNDTTWLASEVGDWFRYTIEVPNLGIAPGYNITFNDDLTQDGAMVLDPTSIVTTVGASSDPTDPALATPQLAAAAGTPLAGVCSYNDGATPGTTRALSADDTIDCFDNTGLAAGDSIFLTYWAQTQVSGELESFGVAGPGIPGSASPDLIRNVVTLDSYNAAAAPGGEIISGDTAFHEHVVFTPIAEVNYQPQGGICSGIGGTETPDGTQFTMTVRTENGMQRREAGDTPVYTSGTWAIRPGRTADYPADPAGFAIGYNQVITVTLAPGQQYAPNSSVWNMDPRIGATTTVTLGEPAISGTVATGQTLTWDSTVLAPDMPNEVDPVLYSNGFWLAPNQFTTPELAQWLDFDIVVPPGDNWGQSWGQATLTYEDQLGNVQRTGGDYQYTMTDPEGCGGQPGNNLRKSPDLPWINPSTGETYDSGSLDSDDEHEFFVLNLTMYVDIDGVWFADYLPAEFTYAGDPSNTATYLADPETNIPTSMFANGGTDLATDMQTVLADSPSAGQTTVLYGPFDLEINDDNINNSGGTNFFIRVPVRRTLPYDEDTSPGQYQNTSAILTGPDVDNLTPTGLGDDGEMEIPPPSADPVVAKRITNWQACEGNVTDACGLYGDTAQFEIVLELPKFFSGNDVVIGDSFHRFNSTVEPDWGDATNISITCSESVVGGPPCDSDDDGAADFDFTAAAATPLQPGMQLPTRPLGPTAIDDTLNDGSLGWYLGDVEAATDGNDRFVVITFDLPTPAAADAGNYANLFEQNQVYLRYDDVDDGRWSQYWDGYDPVLDEGPNNAFAPGTTNHLQNWADSLFYSHSGSVRFLDTVAYRIGYPTLFMQKSCTGLELVEADWLQAGRAPTLHATPAGTPNVTCTLSVRNTSTNFNARDVVVTEDDDLLVDTVFVDPNQSATSAPVDVEWEVTAITAGGAFTTAPTAGATAGDLQDFAWTIGQLDAGETVEISFEARVDYPATPFASDPDGSIAWRISNQASIDEFYDDPDQYVAALDRPDPEQIDRTYTRSSTFFATRPRVSVTKFPVDAAERFDRKGETLTLPDQAADFALASLLIDCDDGNHPSGPSPAGTANSQDVRSCFYDNGLAWYESDAYDHQIVPSSTTEWGVGFEIHLAEAMSEVRLADSLPFGMTYVPGTARLWNLSTGGSVPMTDPAVTAASGVCNATGDHTGGGDSIEWTFAPGDADPLLAAPFATDEASLEAAGFSTFEGTRGIFGVISFDVAVADYDTISSCYDGDFGSWDWFENQATIEADHAADLGYEEYYDLEDDAFLQVPFRDGITLDKLPDDALEISGTTPEFTIEIENHTEDLTYTDLTVTDTLDMTSDAFNELLDAGSCAAVDAALCPWIEVVSTSQPGFVPVFNEDSFTWSSGPPNGTATIVWSIAALPPETVVVIHMPIESDRDTPTGTEWLNDVVLDSPDMYAPLEQEADITFLAPSPPPPVSKSGLDLGTVGSQFEVTVDVVLASGEAWLDLAAVDLVPDGVDFIDYSSFGCTFSAGPATGTACDSSMIIEMTPAPGTTPGTTGIGWWFGDIAGDAANDRTFTFTYSVQVADVYADGTAVQDGDSMTNTVYTVSSDYVDWLASPDTPTTDPFDVIDDLGGFSWPPEQGDHTTVIGEPELLLDKSVEILSGETPLEPGDVLQYTVVVTNVGTWPAFLVPVSDTPSPSVVIDNATFNATVDTGAGPVPFAGASLIDGWAPVDPALTFFIGAVGEAGAPDGSDVITLTYEATVSDDYIDLGLGSIDNVAAITGYQNDATVFGEPGRTYDPPPPADTTLPVASPSVTIEKFTSDCVSELEVVDTGSSSNWCLVVENVGGNVAYLAEVNELLPLGWTYDAGSSIVTPAVATEPTVTTVNQNELLNWAIGDIAPGEQVQIVFSATVAIGAPQSVVNVSSVITKQRIDDGAGGFEFVEPPLGAPGYRDNDSATKSLSEVNQDIAKGVGDPYDPAVGVVETSVYEGCATNPTSTGGCDIDWYIIAVNEGDSQLTDIVVTDYLPVGLTYVPGSATSVPAGAITEVSAGPGPAGTTEIIWTIDAMAAGDQVIIDIPSTAVSGLPHGTEFLNHSELYSNEIPDQVENQAKATITESSEPPTITKVATPDERTVGEPFDFTITVDLPGPQVLGLHDVTIVDILPTGLNYIGTTSASCVSGCDASVNVTEITSVANADGSTDLGWWVGSVEPIPADGAQIVIVYQAYGTAETVDIGELVNSASVLASVTPQLDEPPSEPPTDPGPDDPWDYTPPPVDDTVEVFAPELVLDKDVSCDPDAEPGDGVDYCLVAPGQVVTYTVTIGNEGTWPAFEIDVVDAIPASLLTNVTMDPANPGTLVDDWTAADPTVMWFIDGPLAVGDSLTFVYTAEVAADVSVDVSIVNIADITSYWGTPEDEQDPTDPDQYPEYTDTPDDEVELVIMVPAVDIEKDTNGFDSDVAPGQVITPGDPVTWTYVVTNTGTTVLIDLLVNDSDPAVNVDCGDGSNLIDVMIPDEVHTCTATGIAGADDYTNDSDVVGTPAVEDPDNPGDYTPVPDADPVEDDDPSNYTGVVPSIDIEKDTNGDQADDTIGPFIAPGGVVTWTYVVENTGDVPLADVVVTDSDPAVSLDCGAGSNVIGLMLPGALVTCVAIGIAELGLYENIADVVGDPVWPTDPTDGCCDPEDPDSWPTDPEDFGDTGQDDVIDDDPSHYHSEDGEVLIEKDTNGFDSDVAPGQVIAPGDAVTWTYVVANASDTPLVNLVVNDSDPLVAVDCGSGSNSIALLLPGASHTCTADGIAGSGPYNNVSDVVGTPGAEDPDNPGDYIPIPGADPVDDDDPSNYTGVVPSIDIEKDTNGDQADDTIGPILGEGDLVTWTYVVENTGDVPLANVVVTDSDSAVTVDCGAGSNVIDFMLPGATATCTATGTAEIGLYENIADVIGDPVWPTDPTDGCCDPDDPDSWPTDPETYEETGQPEVIDDDPSHYVGAEGDVSIEKATNGVDADVAPGPIVYPGDPITWTYTVLNTSGTPLVDLIVTDDQGEFVNCGGGSNTIPLILPGGSHQCTASGIAIEGQYENLGSVIGTPAVEDPDNPDTYIEIPGADPVEDDDPSHYAGLVPAIDIEKDTNGDQADITSGPLLQVGDVVTWTYAVENTGDVALLNVVVNDSDPAVSVVCNNDGTNEIALLVPGYLWLCTAQGVAELGAYENIADVTGTPAGPTDPSDDCCDPDDPDSWLTDPEDYAPTGQDDVIDDDPSHYLAIQPSVMIEKATNGIDADEAPGPVLTPGVPVEWTYVVTNDGLTALVALDVTDDQGVAIDCGDGTNTIALLLPGNSHTCTASGVAADGAYVNVGSVEGDPAIEDPDEPGTYVPVDGADPVDDDDPSNHLGLDPSIDIEKTTNGEQADATAGPLLGLGDPVEWVYEVTNDGAVPVVQVTVSDSDPSVDVVCPGGTNVIALLVPGESVTCAASGIAIAGQYENLGSASGEPVWPSDPAGDCCDPGDPDSWPEDPDAYEPTGQDDATDEDLSHYVAYEGDVMIQKATNGEDADTVPGPLVAPGDAVTWTYVVTNTSGNALVNLTVSDDQGEAVDCGDGSSSIALLLPGEIATCSATGSAEAGQYMNTGSVVGTPGQPDPENPGQYVPIPGAPDATDDDPSHYLGGTPDVSIEKATNGIDADTAADGPDILEGDAVTWTYVVTNDGDLPVVDLVVTDDQGVSVDCGEGDGTIGVLMPGDSHTCEGVGVAGESPYQNVGEVTGLAAYEDPLNPGELIAHPDHPVLTGEDPSHYTGIPLEFDLALRKRLLPAGEGERNRTFTIEVFNQGSLSATDIEITDHLPEGLELADADWTDEGERIHSYVIPGPLEPGESVVVEIDINVVVLGDYVNVAGVASAQAVHPESGEELSVSDIDSPFNDTETDFVVDDVIDNSEGDEDDSDIATLNMAPPPASSGTPGSPALEYPGPFTPASPADPPSDPPPPSGPLAYTGGQSRLVMTFGYLLLIAGLVVVVAGRRRRFKDED